ncbi:undecaprenyl-diphosphate phosphatase [Lysinibacillus sphaericus]|uniref:Undecaprenyl-diphosphatase n=3 Tax=Lysinibacillus TaxID=400634 RepID=A0A2S0K5D3_LYSSH|nr:MULTISPECIES: undecaprenyl-diphosphate phosphatase [Lysinibacillus]AHN20356.1 UDP pyrophosphate phosphatase [Lysinibacillus varians]AVK98587.1 undecaprenyl-diphosphatase [Lysinibacillus sphaericus]MCS1381144.1 undecaprenyl-diphosphate phosphatase [Lysinibacillus sphaericus]MED4544118.1 undecaprenyl-diphosphate phosphatase [Lysinibacillus sphaericus]TKI17333.1 undecaprenyl-diphosphate phosphatase [Lysinibacillus sphaericus]
MEIIELLKALILGFVEGMTEFAPVSSTGHMIIVDDMWLKTEEFLGKYPANTFKIVVQLGSILAVIVVMWKRMLSLVGLYNIDGQSKSMTGRFNLMHVIVGMLPAVVLGFAFKDFIDDHLFKVEHVIYALVAGSILMIAADKLAPRRPKVNSLDEISYGMAFKVGLVQCLSLWPGFSRSGATISGGVLFGISHRVAADFTFIMAVPIMAGASLVSVLKNWDTLSMDYLGFYVVGFISSFVFALLSIKFFLALISKVKLMPFAIYRLVLAAILSVIIFM